MIKSRFKPKIFLSKHLFGSLLTLIAFSASLAFISCDKTPQIEEVVVTNCIEATYLGNGCDAAFFSIEDTSKVKGTFTGTSWYSGTLFGFADMIEKKLPPPYRVFAASFWDSKLQNVQFKSDKKYIFEFRKPIGLEKNTGYVDRGRCFPYAALYDQIVLLDTLSSNCTKIK